MMERKQRKISPQKSDGSENSLKPVRAAVFEIILTGLLADHANYFHTGTTH